MLLLRNSVQKSVSVELASVWADGAEGGVALAEAVVKTIDENAAHYTRLYDNDSTIEAKIEELSQKSIVAQK